MKSDGRKAHNSELLTLNYQLFTSLLVGYGQILFCPRPASGLLILAATFLNPSRGLLGLIGALSAQTAALLLSTDERYLKAGLFACNGALVGMAIGHWLVGHWSLVWLVIIGGFLAGALLAFLIKTISERHNLPSLSIAFVLVTWLCLLSTSHLLPPAHTPTRPHAVALPAPLDTIEQTLQTLPPPLTLFPRLLSGVFFASTVLGGLLCLAGVVLHSRISLAFAILGTVVGAAALKSLGVSVDDAWFVPIGCNTMLIAIALGGVLVTLRCRTLLYVLLGVLSGVLASLAMVTLLRPFSLPILVAPFNLVTLLFLLPLTHLPHPSTSWKQREKVRRLARLPLYAIFSPEQTLHFQREVEEASKCPPIQLSLPFYGCWFVSQGVKGKHTHYGAGAYAWDFIVLDEEGRSFKGLGTRPQDYYAFGKPVIAPADGTVVKVVNDIEDNTPPEVNRQNNWGNYVIIAHGDGIYSEISHLKKGSIRVYEGQFVRRGELLGCCGNSGRSVEPHLHFQLQGEPFAGAPTLPARFSHYVICDGEQEVFVKEGIPQEGQIVRNASHSAQG